MFGYVTVNKPELKIREFDEYRSWYCGLCSKLKEQYGRIGQITLSYDMTFLVMVLQGVYEPDVHFERRRCLTHPAEKHDMRTCRFSKYGADMNVLLAYHNFMDDWLDDKNVISLTAAQALKNAGRRIAAEYPRQNRAVVESIKALSEYEKAGEMNIDKVSGSMGELLGELFVYEKDIFSDTLYRMGFFLGKFIYLMDAYEDVEKDIKKGRYNPLSDLYGTDDFEEECLSILNMMMAECAREFEKLPILENVEILRNILYSGVWVKHALIHQKRSNTGEDESNDRSL